MVDAGISVGERVLRLLAHLDLPRAHVLTGRAADAEQLLLARADAVASAAVLGRGGFDPTALRRLEDRLLVVYGTGGPAAPVEAVLPALPEAATAVLAGYPHLLWSDVVADRTDELGGALVGFLDGLAPRDALPPAGLAEGEGEVEGITYHVRGAGPPLLLFPLMLAPTQWDALLPRLAASYCTIVLGGRHLGFLAVLEERGRAWGYRKMVGAVLDELRLSAGATVLEVGCGSGVLCRWLAERSAGASTITGVDVSPYLLREAAALAASEGVAERIDFRAGDAQALPFDDDAFDATFSITVMEEVDAEKMLAEMVRVTRPGGRIGVVVRADGLPHLFNVPVRPEILAKVEARPCAGKSAFGCADPSLFTRMRDAGLRDLRCWRDASAFYPGRDVHEYWQLNQGTLPSVLTPTELAEWRAAVARAQEDQTLFWAPQYHCAVGTRPAGA